LPWSLHAWRRSPARWRPAGTKAVVIERISRRPRCLGIGAPARSQTGCLAARMSRCRNGIPGGLRTLECPRAHKPLTGESSNALDIDGAPDTARPSRCEPDAITYIVNSAPHPVDPAKRQRAVDGLGPRDAPLSRVLLVESNQQFFLVSVMFLEPVAPGCGSGEEFGFHSFLNATWRRALSGERGLPASVREPASLF